LVRAVQEGAQTLAFTRTRQAAELIHRYAKESLEAEASPLARQVRAYRGGYLPNERREIEQALFSGQLRAAAATNALELGVDIGSLDVVLMVGYPGTIASTWQQAGRSGRRGADSLSVLIAANDPIDQYLLRHPDYFWSQSPEHAVVDPENPYVLANHLQAAAFELPLDVDDVPRFGSITPQIAGVLVESGALSEIAGRYYFSGGQNPSSRMNLRHMSDNTFAIVLRRTGSRTSTRALTAQGAMTATRGKSIPPDHEVIANVDAISAPELVYPEGVYLHNGEPYFVRELDLEGKVAYVERHEMDYYTQAVLDSKVQIIAERRASAALPSAGLHYGEVAVTWQTIAFKKIKFGTRENIGYGPVDIPAQTLPTTALWLAPGDDLKRTMKASGFRTSEGLCGLRNLAIVALPMIAMCDSRDTSGVVDSQNLGRSALVLYDRYPGGLGYCEKGFYQIYKLLELCWQMVRECECVEGCPSCVGLPNLRPAIHSDPDLTRGYPIPDKQATLRLLELLCAAEVEPNAALAGQSLEQHA
jgi:DEAD/DEAH box helicase domain-containing protein